MRIFTVISVQSVKWRKVLLWFFGIFGVVILVNWGEWAIIAVGFGLEFILLFMTVAGVWASAIHGAPYGEPPAYVGFSWLWSHTYKEPELSPSYGTDRESLMAFKLVWCDENKN